jgi:hypothetical protein
MTSSVIVPPIYLAEIYGAFGVKITASEVRLLDQLGRPTESKTYRHVSQIANLDFGRLVDFVRGAQ